MRTITLTKRELVGAAFTVTVTLNTLEAYMLEWSAGQMNDDIENVDLTVAEVAAFKHAMIKLNTARFRDA